MSDDERRRIDAASYALAHAPHAVELLRASGNDLVFLLRVESAIEAAYLAGAKHYVSDGHGARRTSS